MALIPLEDLTKALTSDEWKASIYQAIGVTGVSTTTWKPGAVVRTLIAISAICLGALSSLVALGVRSGFVSLASGAWLRLAAKYERNVDAIEATFAAGSVLLSNSSGNTYILAIGDLLVSSASTRKTYRNTAAVTLNPVTTNTSCACAAVESGSASTAFVGEIDTVNSGLLGVTVTNAVAFIGLDAEEDPALLVRCDEKLGSLSPNGPSDGYRYWAKLAVRADGSSIGVTRARVVPQVDLSLDVYVATATGGVTGTQDNIATDLGAVHDLLQRNVVPIPITERTHSAGTASLAISYTAYLYNSRGLTETQIGDGIAAALARLVAGLPIGGNIVPPSGGKLYRALIEGAIVAATSSDGIPLGIFRVDLATPAADVAVASSNVLTLGAITAVIVQLPPPQGSI